MSLLMSLYNLYYSYMKEKSGKQVRDKSFFLAIHFSNSLIMFNIRFFLVVHFFVWKHNFQETQMSHSLVYEQSANVILFSPMFTKRVYLCFLLSLFLLPLYSGRFTRQVQLLKEILVYFSGQWERFFLILL